MMAVMVRLGVEMNFGTWTYNIVGHKLEDIERQ